MTATVKQRAYRVLVNGDPADSIDATCQEEAMARARRLYPPATHGRVDVLAGPAELYAAAEEAAERLAERLRPLSVWERLRVLRLVLGP